MHIHKLEIKNFKKLVEPVVIDGIANGLTVISGENEEGKSTILKALRAVFFDRHGITGAAADAMQPFGSSLRPEIQVDFELNGNRYILTKAFCQKQMAELLTPTGKISGPEVEERLQELLKFTPPKKGPSCEDNHGIWGLFWVEQGTTFNGFHVSDQGRLPLQNALESEVGNVLGGERGRKLLLAAVKHYEEYFTKNGKPRGDYLKSIEHLVELKTAKDNIAIQLQQYENKVDELQKVRRRLNDHRVDQSLETACEKLQQIEESKKIVDELTQKVSQAEQGMKLEKAKLDIAASSWQQRLIEINSLKDLEQACSEALAHKEDAQKSLTPLENALANSKQEAQQAQVNYELADQAFTEAQLLSEYAAVSAELEELKNRETLASQTKKEADEAVIDAEAILITESILKNLRLLEGTLINTKASLEAIATQIEFCPNPGKDVIMQGSQSIQVDNPLLLTEKTTLGLADWGEIIITPGGSDLSARTEALQKSEKEFNSALQKVGVATLQAAESHYMEKQSLLNKAEGLKKVVKAHAPEGIEKLIMNVSIKEAALSRFIITEETSPLTLSEAQQALRQRQIERQQAEQKLTDERQKKENVESRFNLAKSELVKVQTLLDVKQNSLNSTRAQLENLRLIVKDEQLQQTVVEAEQILVTSQAKLEIANRDLELADPETVELRLEAAKDAEQRIRADINELKQKAHDLEIELQALGQGGLGEQAQKIEGDFIQATMLAERMKRNAEAVKLLYETLSKAEIEAKENFLAPVRERLKPYLRILMSDADIVLDESGFQITHLRRNGVDEPYASLSVGTREQLAVLTRLAFADLLNEQGHKSTVILDDALVYSDEQRFEQMQLILRRAAKNLQIIILTCRERDYQAMGAPIIRLADCIVNTSSASVN